MRPFVILTGLLAASLIVSALLLRSNHNLREELAKAEAELAILNLARQADAAAMTTSKQGREAAAHVAQEQRDALHEVEKDAAALSDSDLLCRLRGVCSKSATGAPVAPGRTDAGLPGTDATSRTAGGE